MSVATTIQELATDIGNAYSKIADKGGTIPQNKNTNNLANAIDSISTGVTPTGSITIKDNGTYDVTDKTTAIIDTNDVGKVLGGKIVNVLIKERVNLSARTTLASQPRLETVTIKDTTVNRVMNGALQNCPNLEWVDIGGDFEGFNNYVFSMDAKFKTLVIRRSTSIAVTSSTTFNGTPFVNGTGGTLYVPINLVSTYSNATNWSAFASTTFASIQENLVTLHSLGIDISDDYIIVNSLPTSDISTSKVYFIETQTAGTYEQWLYNGSTWTQLANITLGA